MNDKTKELAERYQLNFENEEERDILETMASWRRMMRVDEDDMIKPKNKGKGWPQDTKDE